MFSSGIPRRFFLRGSLSTSTLVFFGAFLHELGVEDLLRAKGYAEVWRTGNGVEEDPRRRGTVRIWLWVTSAAKIL